jgi:hypothetical protein
MLYLVALYHADLEELDLSEKTLSVPRGVHYNVIRRPLSGGKGAIIRHKATAGAKCPKCKGEGRLAILNRCPKCGGAGRIGGKPEESREDFYGRVAQYVRDEPETYFMRWNVLVSPADVNRFETECLIPVLENLCDDWEWWKHCYDRRADVWNDANRRRGFPAHRARHFRMPFGVWSPLLDGGATDLDEFIASGSTAGLERVETLFPELEGGGG